MRPLYKTTIVIWSDTDPRDWELATLARDAETGASYCSQMRSEIVTVPTTDPAWDGTEFFDDESNS